MRKEVKRSEPPRVESKVLSEFADAQTRCWLCGTMAIHTWPPRLEIHHAVRGADREKAREEVCCIVRTCQRCHTERLDSMPLARQLALIKKNNPDAYDRVKVNRLRGGPQMLMGRNIDNAVTECDVLEEVAILEEMAKNNPYPNYPYPLWKW